MAISFAALVGTTYVILEVGRCELDMRIMAGRILTSLKSVRSAENAGKEPPRLAWDCCLLTLDGSMLVLQTSAESVPRGLAS